MENITMTREELINDWPLKWISFRDLSLVVQKCLDIRAPSVHKNIIDPFSALFDMAVTRTSYDEWFEFECARQRQKTLQNHIGTFHQSILGMVEGWKDLGTGNVVDLVNHERKIFAEVKNKFNTVKASDLYSVYEKMGHWRVAGGYRNYTGYFVQIISKDTINRPFTPSNNTTGGKAAPDESIREIDGRSFYTLVTGSPTALLDLYRILPYVIALAIPGFKVQQIVNHNLYQELFTRAFK